jgi:ribosomal protein S18 acetylase RimI-like enzyme
MSIFIQQATTADAALIADLSRQTFYDTFAPDNTAEDMKLFLTNQFTRESLMMELGLQENIFLVAYSNSEVAGYAKMRESRKPAGITECTALEIARLYATKENIGKGVGKQLMQACIDMAKEKEKAVLWLCVWENNKRAISFYEKWGFEKFGDCEFVLGNDVQQDWMMKKALT